MQQVKRRIAAAYDPVNKRLDCPYGCNKVFNGFKSLQSHLLRPQRSEWGLEHERLRLADGWDDENASKSQKPQLPSVTRYSRKRARELAGYGDIEQLPEPKRIKVQGVLDLILGQAYKSSRRKGAVGPLSRNGYNPIAWQHAPHVYLSGRGLDPGRWLAVPGIWTGQGHDPARLIKSRG